MDNSTYRNTTGTSQGSPEISMEAVQDARTFNAGLWSDPIFRQGHAPFSPVMSDTNQSAFTLPPSEMGFTSLGPSVAQEMTMMDPFLSSPWTADTASGAFYAESSHAEHDIFSFPDHMSADSVQSRYQPWYTPVEANQENYFPLDCQEQISDFIPVLPRKSATFVDDATNLPMSRGSDTYHEPSLDSGRLLHTRSDSFHSQFGQQDNFHANSVGNGVSRVLQRHPSQDNGVTQRPRRISAATNPLLDPLAWPKEPVDQDTAYAASYKNYQVTPDHIRDTSTIPLPGFTGSSAQVAQNNASPAASCVSNAISELSAPRASPLSAAANQGIESDGRARTHPLYSARAGSDGNYHCPYAADAEMDCGHKPTKLKCNYEYGVPSTLCKSLQTDTFYSKYIDSHIKPFRCKHKNCNTNDNQFGFSSTACLLRHEREAHGLHGHGTKPFLCHFNDCERAVHDNGFPRNYNLLDHMKRVHGYRPDKSARASPAPKQGAKMASKVRKRKADAPQMLRQRSGTANSTRKSISVKKEQSPEEHKQQLEHQLQTRVGRLHQEIQHMNDPQQVVSHLQQASQEIAGLQPAGRFR